MSTKTFELITYSLLPDGSGGKSVNDAYHTGTLIELECREDGITTEEDQSILEKLGLSPDEAEIQEVCEDVIYITGSQGDPLCELSLEEE
jgi:hypothetical protein